MDDRTAVVAATLTFLVDGWVSSEDQKDLQDTLDRMQSPVEDWTCCPLCAEIVCDDHCPLYPVRDDAGLWIGSKGHTEAR